MVARPTYPENTSRQYSPIGEIETHAPRCEICGAQQGVVGVHNIHGHWFSLLAIMDVAGGFAFDEHGPRYRAHFGEAMPEPTELDDGRCQWCRKGRA